MGSPSPLPKETAPCGSTLKRQYQNTSPHATPSSDGATTFLRPAVGLTGYVTYVLPKLDSVLVGGQARDRMLRDRHHSHGQGGMYFPKRVLCGRRTGLHVCRNERSVMEFAEKIIRLATACVGPSCTRPQKKSRNG